MHLYAMENESVQSKQHGWFPCLNLPDGGSGSPLSHHSLFPTSSGSTPRGRYHLALRHPFYISIATRSISAHLSRMNCAQVSAWVFVCTDMSMSPPIWHIRLWSRVTLKPKGAWWNCCPSSCFIKIPIPDPVECDSRQLVRTLMLSAVRRSSSFLEKQGQSSTAEAAIRRLSDAITFNDGIITMIRFGDKALRGWLWLRNGKYTSVGRGGVARSHDRGGLSLRAKSTSPGHSGVIAGHASCWQNVSLLTKCVTS